ncbi:hypothetical protein U1Q18_011095 [Sarracenia purpurea var. burkii]
MGWTLLKTKKDRSPDSGNGRVFGANSVFLFRKVDTNRVRTKQARGDGGNGSGQCRIRELRLPPLDFRNAPLRILQMFKLGLSLQQHLPFHQHHYQDNIPR